MKKIRLAVFFGGITVEHEVSVITGVQLMKHVDRNRYDVTPVYIDKAGKWWTGADLFESEYYANENLLSPDDLQPFSLSLNAGENSFDVALLCFHGEYGEAGSVQGLLELAHIPYQGPGVISSAIAFDKIVTRQIFDSEKIPQPNFIWFTHDDWKNRAQEITEKVAALSYPVFVKPARGGSTVGIEKVKSVAELSNAIERVLQYDTRVIIEAEVKDCIEINVSVLGIDGDLRVSVPEQPMKADEFLSYADKYQRGGGKKGGMASLNRRIPAPISSHLTLRVQDLAKKLFHLFDCSGVVRIDFFVNPSEESVFVTELNTIPGSMSFYLWEASGLPYKELINELVEIAFEKEKRRSERIQTFETNILKKV